MQEDVLSLCAEYTDLTPEERRFVRDFAIGLSSIAELGEADVFLDCLCRDKNSAIVVAEARRTDGLSLYREDVVGKLAFPENEPGVFKAFQSKEPCRELRALTQENVPVQQNAVPLFGENGKLVAVLVKENSIQEQLDRNRKLKEVTRTNRRLRETIASMGEPAVPEEQESRYLALQLREMNHRIKNNLQMISSMMSMEARRCGSPEAEDVLNRNVARILTVASFHDMLSSLGAGSGVEVKMLLDRVVECVRTCLPAEGCRVEFSVSGSDMVVPAGLAGALVLAVNELLTNSAKHAFPGRENGRIEVLLLENPPYRSIVVQDDGVGFEGDIQKRSSLGLNIVEAIVRDKIKGVFSLSSGVDGTGGVRARIDFTV